MSKFKELEAVVARCSSKEVLSKILQITPDKHPCWSLPSTKPQALTLAALLKETTTPATPPAPYETWNMIFFFKLQEPRTKIKVLTYSKAINISDIPRLSNQVCIINDNKRNLIIAKVAISTS